MSEFLYKLKSLFDRTTINPEVENFHDENSRFYLWDTDGYNTNYQLAEVSSSTSVEMLEKSDGIVEELTNNFLTKNNKYYNFNAVSPNSSHLRRKMIQEFNPNFKELLAIYNKCYQKTQSNYIRFLEDCTGNTLENKECFREFFSMGTSLYQARISPHAKVQDKLYEVFKTLVNYQKEAKYKFSSQEVKEIVLKHFENSVGINNFSSEQIMKSVSFVFNSSIQESNTVLKDFLEDILVRFKNYDLAKAANNVSPISFTLMPIDIMSQYGFLNVEDIGYVVQKVTDYLVPSYEQLHAQDVSCVVKKINENSYFKVIAESADKSLVDLDVLKNVYYNVFQFCQQKDFNIDKALTEKTVKDIVFYNIMSKTLPSHEQIPINSKKLKI